MARGSGAWGDSNRDGINDDFDRRPGNSTESSEYSRRYDPFSVQEFSNRLEPANQQQLDELRAQYEQGLTESRDAFIAAQSSVQIMPNVGKFIIPENRASWIAHANLVKTDRAGLGFNPEKYIYFDKIIAERYKNPALTDPNHPDYAKFEGLRTNLEVLRNDIYSIFFKDGSFDPGDEWVLPDITGMAATIGDALNHDKWYKRPFLRSVSVDVANVEGIGARELYKHLLDSQDPEARNTSFRNKLMAVLNVPVRNWRLPPLEETPFSAEGLSAAPSPKDIGLDNIALPSLSQGQDIGDMAADKALRVVSIARRLNDPQSLDVTTQENAIDEARTILRYLKNLKGTDQSVEEWISQGTPAEQQAKSEALSRLVEIYAGALKSGDSKSNEIRHGMVTTSANEAAGTIALSVAGHTLDTLPDNHARIMTLEDALTDYPASWEHRQNHSTARLLEIIETGIEFSSRQNVSDKTSIDRLVEMANRIESNARKLQSVNSMAAPARMESVELAREILRKLKKLGLGGSSLDSLMKSSDSDTKADLAQQLAEMTEIYQNIVAEALEKNPDLFSDRRIREANDAVGQFSHTIKLMAAKEIPTSHAASQQISADIANMPEEWKSLNGRTVDRLTQAMEGGLERAVADLQTRQQEQQQQQDEELASKSVENQLLGEMAGKKKRRRRSSKTGGSASASLKKSAKRRNANDLNGDGVADKLQGLGLNEKDLIAIRQLGGNLRGMGEQFGATAPEQAPLEMAPVANVMAPDGQSFVEQQQNRSSRSRNRRNNPRSGQKQI
jgi:hypothetical protein